MLQDAMKKAGIDPSEVKEPSSFEQLFSGMSSSAAAPAKEAAAAPAAEVVFAPKFKTAKGFDSITGNTWKLNDTYFADEDTAKWVAAKYGTGEIRESDVLGPGPFGVDTKMFEVKLDDGRWVNAGMVAAYYDRNPEALFPGLADKLIRGALKQA